MSIFEKSLPMKIGAIEIKYFECLRIVNQAHIYMGGFLT